MKKLNFRSRACRIAVAVAVPLILIAGATFLYVYKWGPPCITHSLTGIYCAGCGAGRASVDLLHGDLLAAIDHNLLFVAALPFVAYYLVKKYISYCFGRDILPFFKMNLVIGIIILVVIVVFIVLRNIPIAPFNYLAP